MEKTIQYVFVNSPYESDSIEEPYSLSDYFAYTKSDVVIHRNGNSYKLTSYEIIMGEIDENEERHYVIQLTFSKQ